jgi:pyruvate kinase
MTKNNFSLPKTKIVATLGPASDSSKKIERLISCGVSVFRLNFSHGTHESHQKLFDRVRKASEKLGRPVAVLQDLCGPKLRVGNIPGGKLKLADGDSIILTPDKTEEGTAGKLSVQYPTIAEDVVPGSHILLADGIIQLEVRSVTGKEVGCRVIAGGILRSRQGMNLPEVKISLDTVTEKDKDDLKFGLKLGVDYVALSFVRRPEDVLEIKEIITASGADTPVIAKLERTEALDLLDGILDAADGVMVARGDLGLELPPEEVPLLQKKIIERANRKAVPVITATQMLESMTVNMRPTRAEVSDVANAILDGTDAVMLSGETATGRYPEEAVAMMKKIALEVESKKNLPPPQPLITSGEASFNYAVATSRSACTLAEDIGADIICAFTVSGYTATRLSNQRPNANILAITPLEKTARRLTLFWGVKPMKTELAESFDSILDSMDNDLLDLGLAGSGDPVVLVYGYPINKQGITNTIYIHQVKQREENGK